MEQHFIKLNTFIDNFKGGYFYEQSFMNTYFNINNVSDYSLFDRNVFMTGKNPNINQITPSHHIIHFNNFPGEGLNKANLMAKYFTEFKLSYPLQYNEYDTRNNMIETLIPQGCVIVEIGVFQGDFAEILAKTNPKHLYLVDYWGEGGNIFG